jgi:hypothetical protein
LAKSPSLREGGTCAGGDVQIGVIVVVAVVAASHVVSDECRGDEHECEGGDEERGGRGPDVQARLAAGSGSSRACASGDGKAAEWFRQGTGTDDSFPKCRRRASGGGRRLAGSPALARRRRAAGVGSSQPHAPPTRLGAAPAHNARRSGEQTLLDRERNGEGEGHERTQQLKWGYRSQET